MVNRLTYSDDVLQPVQKEDDADQEQQMVVAGDHVLGAEIHQRTDRRTVESLQEHGVLARDAMRARRRGTSRAPTTARHDALALILFRGSCRMSC